MGEIIEARPVKLFIAITYHNSDLYQQTLNQLTDLFGSVEQAYHYDFAAYTNYYEEEMGSDLQKTIVSFNSLVEKDNSPQLKYISNEIEDQTANQQTYPAKRKVNIDPGYLTEAKVILLTTKNFAHRVYVGQGIFAEIALTYRKTGFSPNNWTYPDYRSEGVIQFFNEVREKYRNQIRYKK